MNDIFTCECVFVKLCRLPYRSLYSIGCDVYRIRFCCCCCWCCSASDLFSFTDRMLYGTFQYCLSHTHIPVPSTSIDKFARLINRPRSTDWDSVFAGFFVSAQKSQMLCCYYGSLLCIFFSAVFLYLSVVVSLCRRECDDLCIKYNKYIETHWRRCYDLMIPYEAISRNVLLASVTSIPRTKQI